MRDGVTERPDATKHQEESFFVTKVWRFFHLCFAFPIQQYLAPRMPTVRKTVNTGVWTLTTKLSGPGLILSTRTQICIKQASFVFLNWFQNHVLHVLLSSPARRPSRQGVQEWGHRQRKEHGKQRKLCRGFRKIWRRRHFNGCEQQNGGCGGGYWWDMSGGLAVCD